MHKQEFRLSTLMRFGAERTKQLTGRMFDTKRRIVCDKSPYDAEYDRNIVGTCAMGAIQYAAAAVAGGKVPSSRHNVESIMNTRNIDPTFPAIKWEHVPGVFKRTRREKPKVAFQTIVIHLNDKEEWSREQIAKWIDAMIDWHGYDLYYELPVELRISRHPSEIDWSPWVGENEITVPDSLTEDREDEDVPSGDSMPAEPEKVAVIANEDPEPAHA